MERIIKFNAWDKKRKVMYEDIYIKRSFIGVGVENKMIPIEDVEILQFTGLVDKNNKEIYEGDLVLCCRYSTEDKFKVAIEDIRNLNKWLFGSNLIWREVIGNKFQ